jgi:hypothetical protein
LNHLHASAIRQLQLGRGWAASFSPIITANLEGDDGDQWTVPLGAGLTKTTVFNKRPMNVGVQYYYNAERPDGSAGQQLRFTIALLFPTAPAEVARDGDYDAPPWPRSQLPVELEFWRDWSLVEGGPAPRSAATRSAARAARRVQLGLGRRGAHLDPAACRQSRSNPLAAGSTVPFLELRHARATACHDPTVLSRRGVLRSPLVTSDAQSGVVHARSRAGIPRLVARSVTAAQWQDSAIVEGALWRHRDSFSSSAAAGRSCRSV